jgi:hypothetical protein
MHRIHFALSFIVLFFSCASPDRGKAVDDSTSLSTDRERQDSKNVLSEDEISEGWTLLFDGESMNGWRVFKKMENNSWEVAEGTLHCKAFNDDGVNQRADLITEMQFENFDLRFEWKITPQANTGVMYHVTEDLQETYMTGPEFQIVDDVGYPGEVVDTQLTGSVYHMYAASMEKHLNPVGEWNESRIVVLNKRAEHWLNWMKVAQYTIQSDDWKAKIASSKWKDFPQFGVPEKGHIALQDHRNEVWFRNLKIKTL